MHERLYIMTNFLQKQYVPITFAEGLLSSGDEDFSRFLDLAKLKGRGGRDEHKPTLLCSSVKDH